MSKLLEEKLKENAFRRKVKMIDEELGLTEFLNAMEATMQTIKEALDGIHKELELNLY